MKAPFDVWINPDTHIKLNEYATAAQPNEIGGLARILIKDGDVWVVDVEMIPQEASMATFDIKSEDINKFATRLMAEGREDEMSEWCSIVHSHPIGMGASMSQTDVQAIKRFAEGEEAFSLIISTDKEANSYDLKMHYCCNIKGKDIIFDDIPVYVAYDVERYEMGKKLAENLGAHFGVSDCEKDMNKLRGICSTFLANKVPLMFSEERAAYRKEIEKHVSELITTRPATFGRGGGWTNRSGLSSGYTQSAWEEEEMAYWEGQWAAGSRKSVLSAGTKSDLKQLHFLRNAMSDPDSTDERRRRAKNTYRKMVTRINKELRAEGGIGIDDVVVVNANEITITQHNQHLITGEHFVDDATGDFNLTLYVGQEAFFPEELILLKPFEEVWAEEDRLAEEADKATA